VVRSETFFPFRKTFCPGGTEQKVPKRGGSTTDPDALTTGGNNGPGRESTTVGKGTQPGKSPRLDRDPAPPAWGGKTTSSARRAQNASFNARGGFRWGGGARKAAVVQKRTSHELLELRGEEEPTAGKKKKFPTHDKSPRGRFAGCDGRILHPARPVPTIEGASNEKDHVSPPHRKKEKAGGRPRRKGKKKGGVLETTG